MNSEVNKLRILIADDDPSILKLLHAIVEGEGYLPVAANDGREAYRILKSSGPVAAAIVDVKMPYIQGSDLVKFMQSDERFADIPVIMMTGDLSARTGSRGFSEGAIAFLPKPFSNSQIVTILRTLIRPAPVSRP